MTTNTPPPDPKVAALRTPRAAAVAGIIFAVLFGASVILSEWAIPSHSEGVGSWVDDESKRDVVMFSLHLLPFAGIAFLWFIGVIRDRLGAGEDRLFATVFLGSGLLFLAMIFVSASLSSGLITAATQTSLEDRSDAVWPFGRRSASSLATVYGLRMAAVFTISATTLALRLRLVPRWLTVLGYFTALVMLFGADLVSWIELVFPAWVMVWSIHILVVAFSQRRAA